MNNKSNLSITIIVAILVIIVGYFTFVATVNDISGPMTSPTMNATMSTGNTIFNIGSMALVIGLITTMIGALFYWVSSPERFKKPSKFIKFLASSCYYFGFGLIGLAIISIPSYLIYFLFNYTVVEGNTGALFEIGKWIGIGLVLFFGIAGFGYIFKKRFVDKLMIRLEENEKLKEGIKKVN